MYPAAFPLLRPHSKAAQIPGEPWLPCGQTPLPWGTATLGIALALPPRPPGGCWDACLLWDSLYNSPAQAEGTQNAEPSSWLQGEEDLSPERMGKPCLGDPRRGLSGVSRFWPLAIFLLRHEKDQLLHRVVEGLLGTLM